MLLRITVQGEINLRWNQQDLLANCQTQGKQLLKVLLEKHHGRVVTFQTLEQDRRLTCSVSTALKYLLDTVWPQVKEQEKRKVTNVTYTLPYEVPEDEALLCLKRLGKSELLLCIKKGHSDVWVDTWVNQPASALPTGTVTFLFTDIEGSSKLWEAYPEKMRPALMRHDTILREVIQLNEGVVFKTIGDAFCAAFSTPVNALSAALAAQLILQKEAWPTPLPLKVRMAMHMGIVEQRDNDYFGQPLNKAARLLAIGHGRQVLLSLPVAELVRDILPSETRLADKGAQRLKDLQRPEFVFQLLHPALPAEFPPLYSLDNPNLPNNLPLQLTSFIGRETEINEVKLLLNKTRLLTLVGAGGCGKTRTALQAAADMLDSYNDGVWLVELASLSDSALVPQVVASVLSVQEEADKPLSQILVQHLKTMHLLLILDNCEHLLNACASLVDSLLRHCPRIQILTSSREGLGIAGELTYRVSSLSLPPRTALATPQNLLKYEAVRLFIERAVFQQPGFTVTDANADALAQVCVRLDGIPLAIELAAARVRSLSIEEINSRLNDRFHLLTSGNRMGLPRQQTLRALIDWSYDLLNEQEKTLLCRLSLFAGAWTLQAAEAVGIGEAIEKWDVLDLLTSLTDKSLVAAEQQEEQTRYHLLESVREYAEDRLMEREERSAIRKRHQAYYMALAEEAELHLRGPHQAAWLKKLTAEHDNLRSALRCAEDLETRLRFAGALWRFWFMCGHFSEGRGYLEDMQTLSQIDPKIRTKALNGAGVLATGQGDYASARRLHEQCLELQRALGNPLGVAHSLSNLGSVLFNLEDYSGSSTLFEEGLAAYRELGNAEGVALTLNNLGVAALHDERWETASACFAESLEIHRGAGDEWKVTAAIFNLGCIAAKRNNFAEAKKRYKECILTWNYTNEYSCIAGCLLLLGWIATLENEDERAACLLGVAERIRETVSIMLSTSDIALESSCKKDLLARMGEQAFTLAWTVGNRMSAEEGVTYTLKAL